MTALRHASRLIVLIARSRRQARPFVSVWIEGAGITLEFGT